MILSLERMHRNGEIYDKEKNESGISPGIKVQYPVNVRCIAKSSQFKFQADKLVGIFYFKPQYLSVRKMVEQGLYFRDVNCAWQKVQCQILLSELNKQPQCSIVKNEILLGLILKIQ